MKTPLGLATALAAAVLFPACSVNWDDKTLRPGDTIRETKTIEKAQAAKAEMVQTEVQMGAGTLKIEGGAKELLEASFRYNVAAWKPEVRYDGGGFRGRLSVVQGKSVTTVGEVVNEWNLKVAPDIPLDLVVRCGAGESALDLRETTLRSVEVHIGVGEVQLDLRNKPQKDYTVQVYGGIGEATVRVPADVGVIAEASGGLGSIEAHGMKKDGSKTWVNDAYGKAKPTIRLEVRGGIGQINLISE